MKATICNVCGSACTPIDEITKPPFYCPECNFGYYDFETYEIDTENMIQGKTYSSIRHMGVDIQGLLNNYKRKKMTGLMTDDNGREISDAECRKYLAECQSKGWKLLPMCGIDECTGFDVFGEGCPGHLKKVFDSSKN